MISRTHAGLAVLAAAATLLSACNGTAPGPALTDPKAIVTAAITSTEAAKSVHLDLTVDGSATVQLPGSATGTPLDLRGTTASSDIDLAASTAKATFSIASVITLTGELIVVDGKIYMKTSFTGPLYVESASSTAPVDPTRTKALIDQLGALLLTDGVNLAKGDDVACGTKSCYTVTADLTAAQLGTASAAPTSGLPIDLTGATVHLTLRVEKDLPYHLAGIAATLTAPNATSLQANLTALKWDQPVTVAAPPADQVKPPS